tara:strand:+ start:869 stop:1729 length:861 start_codon:yes stop_codon:yes gene_type:complete
MSFSKEAKPDDVSKYVDVLDEDKPISGQKFVCVSFISPEKIIKQKEVFIFEQFLKQWDMNKSLEKFQQFLNFISYKYNLKFDEVMKDMEDFVSEEKNNLSNMTIEDDFKTFVDNKEEELEQIFNVKHNFKTNVRGLKVRGVFPSQEEAEMRCKMLREIDPNHDVYVGPVGLWMPWEPEAYKTGRVEYLEKELNELMHNKNKNQEEAKVEFDKRVKEAKAKAMEDNKEIAEKSGNILTQTLNEDGNLVNVNEFDESAIDDEDVVTDKVSSANIRKELFDKHNPKKED